MSKGRSWKFLLLVVPWLVLLPLALELWAVAGPALRERANPYVLARWHGAPWPHPGAASALVDQVAPAKTDKLRVPTPEEEAAAHLLYLATQDDATRSAYAANLSREVYFYNPDNTLRSGHGQRTEAELAYQEKWLEDLESQPAATIPGRVWKDAYRAYSPAVDAGFAPIVAATALAADSVCGILHQHPLPPSPPNLGLRYPYISFLPHGDTSGGGFPEFRINNYGFRDDDIVVPRPDEIFRIACIGASTTMEGSSNGFTYPNLVERFLKEKFPDRNIEVINCGVAGQNTTNERNWFANYLMTDPNLLVFYEGVNDICHLHMASWRHRQTGLKARLQWSRFVAMYADDWLMPSEATMREDLTNLTLKNMDAMADYAKAHGVPSVFCTFSHPDGPNLTPEERIYFEADARLNWTGRTMTLYTYLEAVGVWNQLLREHCQAKGIPCIDVAQQLTGGGQVFGDICHMKDYAIEQKAHIIAEGLEPLLRQHFSMPSS